jgi:hypothetical protein
MRSTPNSADQTRGAHGVAALEDFIHRPDNGEVTARLGLSARLERARAEQQRVRSAAYRDALMGSIGRQPLDE